MWTSEKTGKISRQSKGAAPDGALERTFSFVRHAQMTVALVFDGEVLVALSTGETLPSSVRPPVRLEIRQP